MRTWAFGVAVGAQLEWSVDRELLFAASAMHDLGLTSAYDGPEWFEERGATAARGVCADLGLEQEKTEIIAEAIALHDQLAAGSREPEVALVHFGAGLDVIGYHAEDVSSATTATITSRWPRLAMKEEVAALLGREAKRNPASPIGLQFRFGFARRIRKAPFPT